MYLFRGKLQGPVSEGCARVFWPTWLGQNIALAAMFNKAWLEGWEECMRYWRG